MAKNRPNILFLMTDELRYDQIGASNPVLKTPCLDALCEESVFFSRAYCGNPVCVPSRAALYSGRYPSQNGVHHNHGEGLPVHETTFMSLLRNGGYHTAVIGKQHFHGSPVDKGYDYEDIIDSHNPQADIHPDALRGGPHDNSYHRFLYENGFREGKELFEPVDDIINRWKVDPRFYVDNFVGERGVEWMRNRRPTDRPWYLCLSFLGPHGPIDCADMPEEALYPLEDIDLPRTHAEDLMAKPAHYRRSDTNGNISIYKDYTEDQVRRIRRAWYANVSIIDRQIGRVLEALKESGEYENTMVVFSTDHGDFTCDLNMLNKGPFLLDVLTHIPLIIKPPVADYPGKCESSLVSLVDLPATWLTAAGLPVPERMRSSDLSACLADTEDRDEREEVYMEAQWLRGLRTRRWKLIHHQYDSDGELYDMENDPDETCNLWTDPLHRDVRADLQERLLNRIIGLGENMHVPWSKYERDESHWP